MNKDYYLLINHKIMFISEEAKQSAEIQLRHNLGYAQTDRRLLEKFTQAKTVKELSEGILLKLLNTDNVYVDDDKLEFDSCGPFINLDEAERLYLLDLRGKAGG